MKNFKIESSHLGQFKYNCEEHGFNSIVIAGPGNATDFQKVGRVVQVRKNCGAFSSDVILIRLMDGNLMSWENQGFFSVSEEYKDYYENLFKEVELDEQNREYSIEGKHKVSGFIVKDMDILNPDSSSSSMIITIHKNNED